jgi:hypothetical protein
MEGVDDAAVPGPRRSSPAVPPEHLRAGDADREVVLERLRAAQAEGRLDLEEFDERVIATLAARTYGELATLTADLPGGPPVPRPLGAPVAPPVPPTPHGPAPAARSAGRGADLRGAAAAWAAVSVTCLVIWGVVGVAAGGLGHPWWIWVTGPWGVVLLMSWLWVRSAGR